MEITTLAALRRALTVGTVVVVTEHTYPELEGEREVLKTQGNGVYLSLPDGHPRKETPTSRSFLNYPKAAAFRANDDGTVSLGSGARPGTFLLTFRIKETS